MLMYGADKCGDIWTPPGEAGRPRGREETPWGSSGGVWRRIWSRWDLTSSWRRERFERDWNCWSRCAAALAVALIRKQAAPRLWLRTLRSWEVALRGSGMPRRTSTRRKPIHPSWRRWRWSEGLLHLFFCISSPTAPWRICKGWRRGCRR